jgi:hypothetical protein
MIGRRFPEIARYWMSEMRPTRLALGAATSLVVAGCLYVSAGVSKNPAEFFFNAVIGLQLVLLLGYGTSRTTASVMTERVERTWDLQRLTPLSSGQLAFGKLIGAPLFALFLTATLVPWAFMTCVTSPKLSAALFFKDYALVAAGGLLWLSLGLLVSAYSDTTVAGASSGTAGALMGFLGVQCTFPLLRQTGRHATIYFGGAVDTSLFLALSALAFGAWAFFAAKWRIGKDLLEPRKFWRLPAFLVFLWAYQTGLPGRSIYAAVILPCFFCYFAGVLNSETAEHWKKWLRGGYRSRLDHVPTWIVAAGTCLLLAAAITAWGGDAQNDWGGLARRYPVIQASFVARDLAFLQWCRFTRSKRPELLALVYLGLAYALPAMLLAAKAPALLFLFYPMPDRDLNPLLNVLPGLFQAGAMLLVLARRLRSLSPEANGPSRMKTRRLWLPLLAAFCLPADAVAAEFLETVDVPPSQASGAADEVLAKGRACLAQVLGGEIQADAARKTLRAPCRADYTSLLVAYEARSALVFTAKEGSFQLRHESVENRERDKGPDAPFVKVGKWFGSGWKDAQKALLSKSEKAARCVQEGGALAGRWEISQTGGEDVFELAARGDKGPYHGATALLELVDAANLVPGRGHMSALTIEFDGPDRAVETWTYEENGKKTPYRITLIRKR